jgi:hypothetical protein
MRGLLALLIPLAGCSLALPFDQELPGPDAGPFELYPDAGADEPPVAGGCALLCTTLLGCLDDERLCHFYTVSGEKERQDQLAACTVGCQRNVESPPTRSQLDHVAANCRASAEDFVARNQTVRNTCTYAQDQCDTLCEPDAQGRTAFQDCTDLPGECEATCLDASAEYWRCVAKRSRGNACRGLRECLDDFRRDDD